MPLDGALYNTDTVHAENGNTYGYPLPAAKAVQQDNPQASTGEWHAVSASMDYIDPAIGGVPGERHRLGWSTGFGGRAVRVAPFTGRFLRPPTTSVASIGPVGRDNRNSRLAAGVNAGQTDYLPDTNAIAQSFISQRGNAAIRAAFGKG